MKRAIAVLLAAGWLACGQSVPNLRFSYKGAGDPAPVAVGAGGTIPFAATLAGASAQIQLFVINDGTSMVSFTGTSSTNNQFTVAQTTMNVSGGQTGQFTLTFAPRSTGAFTSVLTLNTTSGVAFLFTLVGSGIGPDFITSYLINPNGNQTPVSDGGTLLFGTAQLSQSVTATFVITNRGSGAGPVSAVSLTGSAFRLAGLPLLPATVDPGAALQFSVIFSPTQIEQSQGTLQVTLAGTTRTISLLGQGAGATFQYEVITGSTVTPISPDSSIGFDPTQVNSSSSVTVRVQNIGNAPGNIGTVTVVGSGFQISNLVPLPSTLAPAGALTFTLSFTPTTPGALTAKLLIDGVTFNLSGTGLGAALTYTFTVGSSVTPLVNGGTASFPNTAVGSTVAGTITVRNTGTVPATINSISVTGQAFGATIPNLPLEIAVNGSISMPISFGPNALGTLNGTLDIDNQSFVLRGIGSAPPTLPSYTFTGVADTALPANQPVIGLTLGAPYAADLTGTLTITFTPESFVDDPAIQFATGGRTVAFRIPANTTQAIFGTSSPTVQFQTGSIAGVITITPAFLTGSVSVTPLPPPVKSVVISSAAPVLRNVQIGTQTSSTFEIVISGFATTRAVSQLTVQFTAASGANLQTTSLTVNADSAFSSWYQSPTSAAAGSQFTASLMIAVNGNLSAVQSVAITATNARGTSNSLSASLR